MVQWFWSYFAQNFVGSARISKNKKALQWFDIGCNAMLEELDLESTGSGREFNGKLKNSWWKPPDSMDSLTIRNNLLRGGNASCLQWRRIG